MSYWVVAEAAEVRCDAKGHCYFTLVEKENDRVIAQARAKSWQYQYKSISQKFEKATGESIKPGMKLLFLAAVEFHEVYGLSFLIKDIDPEYSLGDMARKKREVIERLHKEGLIDRNKSLKLPLAPQRVAVVSAAGAAGYGDLTNHLENNPYGYKFHIQLFPAIMQGNEAEQSIVAALGRVQAQKDSFDAVAIVRGGGSQVELNCYDGYELAAAIARMPLPVFTGIGHERDDTVADMISHTRMKTPTAVADFLISGLKAFEDRVLDAQKKLAMRCEKVLKDKNHNLAVLMQRFQYAVKNRLKSSDPGIMLNRLTIALPVFFKNQKNQLDSAQKELKSHASHMLRAENDKLTMYEKIVKHLDPLSVLRRGYCLAFLDGKVLKSVADAKSGAMIDITLHDGTVKGTIQEVIENGK